MASSVDFTRLRSHKCCSLCYDPKRQEVRCVCAFELGLDHYISSQSPGLDVYGTLIWLPLFRSAPVLVPLQVSFLSPVTSTVISLLTGLQGCAFCYLDRRASHSV